MSLLKSLGIERDRWQNTSEGFKSQMATLVGDVFLSSAFLSYAGYFDQQSRQNLFTAWKHHLDMANILYRHDIARTEFLSDPDQRVGWQANNLPTDDLCTENAIMLSRFNRYPLIIDPSGQATEFIMNEFKVFNWISIFTCEEKTRIKICFDLLCSRHFFFLICNSTLV